MTGLFSKSWCNTAFSSPHRSGTNMMCALHCISQTAPNCAPMETKD